VEHWDDSQAVDRPEPLARLGLPGGGGSRLGEQRVGRWIGLPQREGAEADRALGRVHLATGWKLPIESERLGRKP